jgi:hypothetical protein
MALLTTKLIKAVAWFSSSKKKIALTAGLVFLK